MNLQDLKAKIEAIEQEIELSKLEYGNDKNDIVLMNSYMSRIENLEIDFINDGYYGTFVQIAIN